MIRMEVNLWPPSTNTYYRNVGGRMVMSARGRRFLADGKHAIRQHIPSKPLPGRLGVKVTLYPPDRRRRDVDNHLKAVLDLLTKAGIWKDDEQIDRLMVTRETTHKKGRFIIEIWQLLE
jgi:crossover junction endodeoxyribonuclease RusA